MRTNKLLHTKTAGRPAQKDGVRYEHLQVKKETTTMGGQWVRVSEFSDKQF